MSCLCRNVLYYYYFFFVFLNGSHHQSVCEKGDSPMLPNIPNHDTDTRPMAFRSASRGTGKEQYPSQLEEPVIFSPLLSLKGRLIHHDNTDEKDLCDYTLPMTVKLHTASLQLFLQRRRVGSCEKAGRRQMIRLLFR